MKLVDLEEKTDDQRFVEWYRKIPRRELQRSLVGFIQKREPSKKIMYKQDWPAYDEAKTNETLLFKHLLQELVLLADLEEKKPGRGPKGFSMRDKIMSLAVKVYYGASLRKTESILKELQRLDFISSVPCYRSLDNFFADEQMAPILDRLITLSSMPLAGFETVAAVDSSGFSVSKYEQWVQTKWGKLQIDNGKKIWRKAHIICGCRTNIILSAKISEKKVADSPVFPVLAREAKRYYDMKEICADKAYLGRENLNFAGKMGMVPYIPFKSNSHSRASGCPLWGKMYKVFRDHEEEFNNHYHKRSNVETCFHILKQRFGSNLTTKGFLSNGVEIKLKVLCHNLCVLIQEFYELGATIDFSECVKKEKIVK